MREDSIYAARAYLAAFRGEDSIDAEVAAEHMYLANVHTIEWTKADAKSRKPKKGH